MKTILITGATSGIGKASAEIFAKEGCRLILTGRRKERLEEVATRLSDEYQNDIHILNFDVQDRLATENAIHSIPENFKKIDVLLNNAGLALG